MSQRESSAAIDDAAFAWAARLDRGPLTESDAAELQAWLVEDVRRRGALARACAVLSYADRARGLATAKDAFRLSGREARATGFPRRWALQFGGAIAATVVAGLMGWEASLWRPVRHYQTRRGEVRRQPLEDGTVVTLNTDTQVAVAFSHAKREVRLTAGEALFDVAKNANRPFYVDAGDIRVRAVGTSFAVKALPGQPTKVVVREGVVEVTRPDQEPLRLIANQQTLNRPGQTMMASDLDPSGVTRELAWRGGMIAFDGASIRAAADEFARYGDPAIVVDDPAVAERTITGLFAANDPQGFAQAVALSLNLKARAQDGKIYLSH